MIGACVRPSFDVVVIGEWFLGGARDSLPDEILGIQTVGIIEPLGVGEVSSEDEHPVSGHSTSAMVRAGRWGISRALLEIEVTDL